MANNEMRSDFVSPKLLAVYDQLLLERVVVDTMWDKFGQAKSIKSRSNTKKGFSIRYKNLLPTTVPLAEYNGTVKKPVKIVREEVEYAVEHYGDHIEYSDELNLYDFRAIQSDFLDILGDHAAISMDTVRRDTLRGGTNVVYAKGLTSRDAVLDADQDIDGKDIVKAILKLKAQGAKKFTSMISGTNKVGTTPIRSAYVGVCSIYGTESLRSHSGWKDVEDYANNGNLLDPREVGSIYDIRVIESANDEGIVTASTGTPGTDKILDFLIIMGKNAYATTTVRGQRAIETIIKPIGSSGAKDPLNQFGTIGWKAKCGCAILNQAWLVRIEFVAKEAVVGTTFTHEGTKINKDKHYYNYA